MATPIFTTGRSNSAFKLSTEFTAPLSEVLSAEAEQAWLFSPLSSLFRDMELSEAKGDTQLRPDIKEMDSVSRLKAARQPGAREHIPGTGVGEFLDQTTAREQVRNAGLSLTVPKGGITQGALDILIERKLNEMRIAESLARADSDISTGALRLATGLGTTLLDPINIASAFIPIVGGARYANLLRQQVTALGRAGVRARVGVVEGAVGAALVEPIILGAAAAEQAEYDLTDSMLNIAFGSVLGGGLHSGGGAILDAIRARRHITPRGSAGRALDDASVEIRDELGRSAVSQMVDGRHVDVEIVGNFTPVRAVERKTLIPGEEAETVAPDVEEIARDLNPKLFNERDDLQTRQKTLRRWLQELVEPRQARAEKLVAELTEEIDRLVPRIEKASAKNKKRLGRQKAELEKARDARRAEALVGDTPDMVKVRKDLIAIDERLRDMAVEMSSTLAEAAARSKAGAVVRPAREPSFKVETIYERDPTPGIGRQIEETLSPRAKTLADVDAAVEAHERVAKEIDSEDIVAKANAEMADAKDMLDVIVTRLEIEEPVFKAEDRAIADTGDLRKAFDAATSCLRGKA